MHPKLKPTLPLHYTEDSGAMVFVLDNYDSFTYNLVQYMGELGAEMIIRRNDDLVGGTDRRL